MSVMYSPLRRAFREHGRVDDCPVYDLHAHMGPWQAIYMPYNDVDSMARRMDLAGVRLVVFCHHSSLNCPDLANTQNLTDARKYPDRLKAWCVINPHYPQTVARDLKDYDRNADVWAGLKLHPDIHAVPMTDKRYRYALEWADERALPMLSHTWRGSPYNGETEVRAFAERYPRIRFLMGHCLHDNWDEAVSIARDYENVYLDLTAVNDERTGVIEKFVAGAGSNKVVFGTDYPWFNHHYYIGAVLAAEITDEDRRNILYRNARRILGIPDR